jgi:hypothetical protein
VDYQVVDGLQVGTPGLGLVEVLVAAVVVEVDEAWRGREAGQS